MNNTQKKPPKSLLIIGRCSVVIWLAMCMWFTTTHLTMDDRKTNGETQTKVNFVESTTDEDIVVQRYRPNREVKREVTLSRGGDVPSVKPLTEREIINNHVKVICKKYNMDPYLIMSIITSESNYNPNETTGICVGLMQISTRWHKGRAARLGVTDFYDPYSNILMGVDYLSELLKQYKDPKLVLMLYNMNHDTAISMYNKGQISYYARSVLARADEYRKGE